MSTEGIFQTNSCDTESNVAARVVCAGRWKLFSVLKKKKKIERDRGTRHSFRFVTCAPDCDARQETRDTRDFALCEMYSSFVSNNLLLTNEINGFVQLAHRRPL